MTSVIIAMKIDHGAAELDAGKEYVMTIQDRGVLDSDDDAEPVLEETTL